MKRSKTKLSFEFLNLKKNHNIMNVSWMESTKIAWENFVFYENSKMIMNIIILYKVKFNCIIKCWFFDRSSGYKIKKTTYFVCFGLVWFYGISIIAGYLISVPPHIYISN